MYKISEKIKEMCKDENKDSHQKFQLLTQYVNEYKEKICQNSVNFDQPDQDLKLTIENDSLN